jgi:hypothetical protein
MWEQVGHRRQHREPCTPARLPVAGAEVDAHPHDVARRHVVVEQPEDRLGDDERDALLEALLQAVEQVAGAVGLGLDDHRHAVIVDLDRVGADVVRPRIERATRAQVEAGVVPMARQQAALDCSAVERETHVRAPIVERERRPLAPEDTDWLGPGFTGEATGPAQLVNRSDPDSIAHECLPKRHPKRHATERVRLGDLAAGSLRANISRTAT